MMRRNLTYLTLLLVSVVLAGSVMASLPAEPDYSFLWNRFDRLIAVDSFVVGVSGDGVVICQYDSVEEVFVQVNQQTVDFAPVQMKRFGDVIAIKTELNDILFLNAATLPEINFMGEVSPGVAFADFVLDRDNLYLSTWFDGLWSFRLSDYQTAQFADSSMKGILVTQLEVINDTLYVLDEYNGILRYDVSADGLGSFIDYLYVPLRAASFLRFDSIFSIALKTNGVLFGRFDADDGEIIDSLFEVPNLRRIFETDTLLVMAGSRSLSLVNKNNWHEVLFVETYGEGTDGDIVWLDDGYRLALPNPEGGFTLYDLDTDELPVSGLSRPGPIEDILLYDNILFTGGRANPVDLYNFDVDGRPEFLSTIYDGLRDVAGVERLGDSLFVLYPQLNRIVLYSGISDPDHAYLESSVIADSLAIPELYLADHQFADTARFLLAVKTNGIDAYVIPDSGDVYLAQTWRFGSRGRLESFAIDGSLLFMATNKNLLLVYRINEDFTIEELLETSTNPVRTMLTHNGRLVVFEGYQITIYDYGNPTELVIDSVVDLPLPVLDAVIRGQKLYTVGEEGLTIFDLTSGYPVFEESGGKSGRFLDVDDRLIAASNGSRIDIYLLDSSTDVDDDEGGLPMAFHLRQNYPNPFNSSTVISYAIDHPARVVLIVYNLLGQAVSTLVDDRQAYGDHARIWDGTDESGRAVASGIYFYRLTVDDQIATRKMVLLK